MFKVFVPFDLVMLLVKLQFFNGIKSDFHEHLKIPSRILFISLEI